ncbi:MAG: LapA family protein [Deltaproteobacteria bacterium]|nr:LapA family protein [Deltaproteobacteria bacterium]
MRFFKVIFATLFVMFGITFIIQNLEILTRSVQLKLDLYFSTFQTPTIHLWGLVLFSFFLGVFTASLYGIYELIKQRQTIRQLQHNLEILSQELKRASGPEAGSSSGEPS